MKTFAFVVSIALCLCAALYYTGKRTETVLIPDSAVSATSISKGSTFRDSTMEYFEAQTDSILSLIDTTDLGGKRKYLVTKTRLTGCPSFEYDSVIDLNYDGYDDYIIGTYGCFGSGLRHGADIYLYDQSCDCYVMDTILPDANVSFFLSKKKMTWFYIGAGGGDGGQMDFIDGKWVETKNFTVQSDADRPVPWLINFPLAHGRDTVFKPYQLLPLPDVIATGFSNEYDYQPFQ